MSSNLRKVIGGFLYGAISVVGVQAQSWEICINPNNNTPYSNPYLIGSVGNDLMLATMGFVGTVTYGGANGPCFDPAITANVRGRIGFAIGGQGSVQTNFDDNMVLTFGMPLSPGGAWSYATTNTVDPTTGVRTKTLFGANPLNLAFVGASDRYIYGETVNNNIRARCRIDVIGDASRIQWTLTNETAAAVPVGIWFGQWIEMFAGSADPATGAFFSGETFGDKLPYITVPGQKPVLTDRRLIRSQDPSNFPATASFNFGQTSPYGLKIENGPTPSTTNPSTGQSDASQASEIVFGNRLFLLNAFSGGDNNFPDVIIPDTFVGSAYIQKFPEQTVVAGGTRTIVHYFRSTWGESNYVLPYTAVVDAPKLVATEDNGSGQNTANGLFNNPFQFRVYIDNVGGYSNIDSGFILNDVKVKLTLPTGLNFVGFPTTTRNRQLTLSQVQSRQILSVDFPIEADGIEFGDLPYQVDITSTPGGTKQIKGIVQVAATPRYRLYDVGGSPTSNAITTPFIFTDSSWPVVLNLSSPADFQAFEWDPQLKGYVISTSAARGRGVFIVNNTGATLSNPLGGGPVTPPDTPPLPFDNSGRYPIQLKSGWNLIGNPYNYPITIGQITGVSASNPQTSRTWAQLVSQNIVNSFLSYWNAQTQSYKFLSKSSDKMLPNTAYWVFVNTTADLTISFPPVFEPGLPGSSRAADDWTQSATQWRLQLVARTNNAIDDQNYIGVTQDSDRANTLRMMEPPTSPTQEVALSIEGMVNSLPARLAQNLTEKQGKQEFKVFVQAKKEGEVNLTWPNLSTVPKNIRVRLVDVATNASRDMRGTSGYTFNATAGSTREFKVQVDVGGIGRALIGNVVVSRNGGRAGEGGSPSPFQINYTLSASASTTIRILGSNGKEVFTVTRGRADAAGENTATWNLKDNANRSVAPGTYRVEVTATTPEGDNVRRIVPVNLVR
ncbi:MAG: hypothetical protein H7Y17_00950 [Chlorobia bacterium]|nr:hypothetical protein [Fimbriimonadaceae bacterium]